MDISDFKIYSRGPGMVVRVCNPKYGGDGNERIDVQDHPMQKS
jgi:hypothetical protein